MISSICILATSPTEYIPLNISLFPFGINNNGIRTRDNQKFIWNLLLKISISALHIDLVKVDTKDLFIKNGTRTVVTLQLFWFDFL